MNFRPSVWLSVAALFLLFIALGCGSSSSANKTAQLRLMDASPTQQSINLLVDNATIQTGIVSQSASGYISQPAGNHTLVIEAFGTSTPLVTQNVSLTANANYTVLAVPPSFGSSQLSMSLLTDDNSTPATGNFKLRIINASPDFGNLDAYITAPGAGISGAQPSVPNLAFQAASSYQTLPAGNYEVYFSVAGQQVISVDSGQFTFSSGQVRTLVLLDNFGSGFTSAFLADAN